VGLGRGRIGAGSIMKTSEKIAAVVLIVLLGAAGYGLLRTGGPMYGGYVISTTPGDAQAKGAVDQTPLLTAQRLAGMVTAADEQPFAQEALRISDHAVDMAFAQALRDAAEHPPALSAEAKEILAKLQASEKALDADKARVAALAAADAKASNAQKDALDDDLELAKSQQELDGDEVEDARQDLIRAGGNPQERIQQMVDQHEATAHNTEKALAAVQTAPEQLGLIHRAEQWRALREKERQLQQAKEDAEAVVARLSNKHNALDAQLNAEKNGGTDVSGTAAPGTAQIPPPTAGNGAVPSTVPPAVPPTRQAKSATQNAAPAKTAKAGKPTPAAVTSAGQHSTHSHDETVSLLKTTKRRAVDQQALSTFDKRIDDQKDLAEVYAKWGALIAAKKRATEHRMLVGVAIILAILLIGLVFDGWLEKLLGKTSLDRRQVQTLRTVTRVSLQVLAVLFVLLVIFGPPSQLGTFLGLAGAGLTVALKDFIVGFLGWFVLMGKNGIRLGDWVEINGVTGEVVELGMFHTVLLETGNWTDSGHPTGRRVTFTNSFAIENHYFNFSTSGQWLWDELQVVLPMGMDPYPIVAAIQKRVTESTAASARQAESEWKQAAGDRNVTEMTAAPAINVKPVVGGVEISVRYITSASERHILRAKLYQEAVDLLGKAGAAGVVEKKSEEVKRPDEVR
jgi:small-conductance mechanosensitive channel